MTVIPYLREVKNHKVTELDVDLAILYKNIPVILSVVGSTSRVRECFRGLSDEDSRLSLLDKSNIFVEYPLQTAQQTFQYKLATQGGGLTHGMLHNEQQEDYIIDWKGEGLVSLLTVYLREKRSIPVTEDVVERVLDLAGEGRIVGKCTVYTTHESLENLSAWFVGDTRVFLHFLEQINLNVGNNFDWSKINSFSEYLTTFAKPIKEKLTQNIEILYNENSISSKMNDKRKPYDGQVAVIQGGIETLRKKDNRFLYLAAGMGSGKTLMGTKVNHIYHYEKGKANYCTLLIAPAITLSQWEEEIRESVKEDVDIIMIEDTGDFIRFHRETRMKVTKPTYILVGKETFKLSYQTKPAILVRHENREGESIEKCLCPDCFLPQKDLRRTTEQEYLKEVDYDRPTNWNRKCQHCDTVLFQAVYSKTKKTSIIDYMKVKNIHVDSIIVDEIHDAGNMDSQIGSATRDVLRRAKKVILLSGTVTNGYASSIYNVLYALLPNRLKRKGVFTEKDFIERYGTVVSTSDGTNRGAYREVEGISPLVFTDFFLGSFIFTDLEDLTTDLPELKEFFVEVESPNEIKVGEQQLLEGFKKAHTGSSGFYSDSVVKHYVNNPFNWGRIPLMSDSSLIEPDLLVQPKNITEKVLPKEEELINICHKEKNAGRKTWVYCDFVTSGQYTEGESMIDRIARQLEESGLKVFVLRSSVKTTERTALIDQKKEDYDVFISHPQLISVGVNLQWCTNYVFYTPTYRVNTVRQSSRRGLRINSTEDNHVYHLYYNSGVEKEIMERYELKRAESEAIEATYNQKSRVSVRTASSLGAKIERKLSE